MELSFDDRVGEHCNYCTKNYTYLFSIFSLFSTSQITHFSRGCFIHHYGGQLKTAVEKEAGEKIDCKRQ